MTAGPTYKGQHAPIAQMIGQPVWMDSVVGKVTLIAQQLSMFGLGIAIYPGCLLSIKVKPYIQCGYAVHALCIL